MRATILLLLYIISYDVAVAKNEKEKTKVLTLSNGKYEEFFDQDSIEQIGSIFFNVNTQKIIGFAAENSTAVLPAEVTSRWLSIDPLAAKYPNISPYAFVANNPVYLTDKDGRQIFIYYQDSKGNNVSYAYGSQLAVPNNIFVQNAVSAINFIKQADKTAAAVVNKIANDPNKTLNIVQTAAGAFNMAAIIPIKDLNRNIIPPNTPTDPTKAIVDEATLPFNPYAGLSDNNGIESISPATAMSHEVGHIFSAFYQTASFLTGLNTPDMQYDNLQERFATEFLEHRVAGYKGEWKRTDHKSGKEIITESPISNKQVVSNENQLGQGETILLNQ